MESIFLRIPVEIRLAIYGFLWSDASTDDVDIANIASFETSPESEQHSTRSYSLLLTHPDIFAEALPYVLQSQTLMFSRPADVGPTLYYLEYNTEHIKALTFDFGKICGPRQMNRSICWISTLPQLTDVTVRINTRQCLSNNGMYIGDGCEFPKLTKFVLLDLDEGKHWEMRDEFVRAFNADQAAAREEMFRRGCYTKEMEWRTFPAQKRTRKLGYKASAMRCKSEAIRYENQALAAKVFQLNRGSDIVGKDLSMDEWAW